MKMYIKMKANFIDTSKYCKTVCILCQKKMHRFLFDKIRTILWQKAYYHFRNGNAPVLQ